MSEEEWDRLCEDRVPGRPLVDAQGFWSPQGSLDWTWPVLVKRLRWMRGLNQRQLAEEAGMAQSHVAKTGSGAGGPGIGGCELLHGADVVPGPLVGAEGSQVRAGGGETQI